jgi:voltage-gated potassium channel
MSSDNKKTLKQRLQMLYWGSQGVSRIFRYGLLIFDILVIVFVIATSFAERNMLEEIGDAIIGIFIVLDFSARLYISRHRLKDLLHPAGIADIIVIFSLLAPLTGEGFAFLRVVRTVRLLRSYHVLRLLRDDFKYFKRNEATIFSALNLGIFIFITTALVFETQHISNPDITNYADALYFTVATLTTTGFGDITLPGSTGRLLSVAIMIFGVSLFIRLVQVMFRPPKVELECPDCALKFHDADAVHCKHCGRVLHIESEGVV